MVMLLHSFCVGCAYSASISRSHFRVDLGFFSSGFLRYALHFYSFRSLSGSLCNMFTPTPVLASGNSIPVPVESNGIGPSFILTLESYAPSLIGLADFDGLKNPRLPACLLCSFSYPATLLCMNAILLLSDELSVC